LQEPGDAGHATFRAAFITELRARREQIGLTQLEFADKAHVSLSSVFWVKVHSGRRSGVPA
jgi:transcriptional regulator with XRE-family HTH domain